MTARLPVTVIGGFLGAGKTTLINRLLGVAGGRRIAVLVNDFGTINIDQHLIAGRDAQVLTLTNGCVCCSLQSDLVAQVESLARRSQPRFEYLLIETSGVSDPGEVLRTLGYPRIRERISVSGIATVVDTTGFLQLAGAARELAEIQLLGADLALLSKLELASGAQAQATRAACGALGVRCLDTDDLAAVNECLLPADAQPQLRPRFVPGVRPTAARAQSAFEHWSFRGPKPYSLAALRNTLACMPEAIYRVKGVVRLREIADTPCIVQVAGSRVEIRRLERADGPDEAGLVFIAARGQVDWSEIAVRLEHCMAEEQNASAAS